MLQYAGFGIVDMHAEVVPMRSQPLFELREARRSADPFEVLPSRSRVVVLEWSLTRIDRVRSTLL